MEKKPRSKNNLKSKPAINTFFRNGFISRLSIKRKLVVIIMVVSSLMMILASGVFFTFQWFTFRQRMVHDISALTKMLADNSTGALSFDNAEDARDVLNSLRAKKSISSAFLFRKNGSLIASYQQEDQIEVAIPKNLSQEGYRFEADQLVMFKKIHLRKLEIGSIVVQMDLSELWWFIKNSTLVLIGMILIASLAAYGLFSKLQKVISTPIFHLADVARKVSINRDYSVRAIKFNDDELGILTDNFNWMLKNIEEQDIDLRHLRNLLINIVDSMPSALVGVDPHGRITQWNLEAERFTGIQAQNARGRFLADVFPRNSIEMSQISQAIKLRQPLKNTKLQIPKDGETRFSDITIYPLIANGIDGAVIRIDDVTEQVRIEEMMIQSEKMLSVGGLAAGMAHEINNPLAGILQNVQVMENRLKVGLSKNENMAEELGLNMSAIQSYMEKRGIFSMIDSVMESGRRAAQIVDNMLSFSRKSESKFTACDLCDLLDKTVELASNDYDLKKKYDFRRIQIQREYQENLPEIFCEKTQIQQVLLNLLKNGAQAMSEKVISTNGSSEPPSADSQNRFILRLAKDENRIRMEIEDNGPGMDEKTRKRIFEPFFTTKEVGTGTGLGLSVSYFIITENHKGTMTVNSTPNQGTTFIIHLPLSPANPNTSNSGGAI